MMKLIFTLTVVLLALFSGWVGNATPPFSGPVGPALRPPGLATKTLRPFLRAC
jgi:hypothetical protein